MARLLLILALTLFCASYVLGATVNTPIGKIAKCATISITYEVTGTPAGKVSLIAKSKATGDEKTITEDLPPAAKSYQWTVDVPAGIYIFGINDGSGYQFSGEFEVIEPKPDVKCDAKSPSGSPSGSPTGSPGAPKTPAATPTGATGGSTPTKDSPTSGTGTGADTSTTTTGKSTSNSSKTGFSLYSLVLSLVAVAAIMVHLA